MSELKPCPFCGGEAKVSSLMWVGGYEATAVCLNEPNCHQLNVWAEDEAEAVKRATDAWNARVDAEFGAVPMTEENMREHGWVRERTCRNDDGWCSECEHYLHDGFKWCPWCGAKAVE